LNARELRLGGIDIDPVGETGLPIELKIVRGDEERTVSVGGTTDASGEA
jgi:hypothetical protein